MNFNPDSENMSIIIEIKCRNYYQNSSGIVLLKDYEGIPENLVVNFAVWIALLVLYTFLRRIGDYGRFGMFKNDEERLLILKYFQFSFLVLNKFYTKKIIMFRWSFRFFENMESDGDLSTASSSLLSTPSVSELNETTNLTNSTQPLNESQSANIDVIEYNDRHFISWLINMFNLK